MKSFLEVSQLNFSNIICIEFAEIFHDKTLQQGKCFRPNLVFGTYLILGGGAYICEGLIFRGNFMSVSRGLIFEGPIFVGLIFGILQYFLRVLLAIEHASADIFMHFVSVGAHYLFTWTIH